MNDGNENGEPIMMKNSNQTILEQDAFKKLADHVSREMLLTQYGHPDNDKSLVRFEGETTTFSLESLSLKLLPGSDMFTVRLLSTEGATQQSFKPACLRSRDPSTGEIIPGGPFLEDMESTIQIDHSSGRIPHKPSPSLKPVKVERRGRYGYAVEWADGATIIYSLQCIATAASATMLPSKT